MSAGGRAPASGGKRPPHRGAQIRQGERLGQHVGDDGVEPAGPFALVGDAKLMLTDALISATMPLSSDGADEFETEE